MLILLSYQKRNPECYPQTSDIAVKNLFFSKILFSSLTHPASGLKLNQSIGEGMFSSRSKLIYSLGLLLRLLALDLMGATSTVTDQQGLMPYSMNPKKDQLRPALEYPVLLDLFRNTALLPADSDYVQIQNQLFHSGAEGQAGVSSSPTPWQTPAWLNSATGSTFGQSASGGSSLRSSGDEADVGSAQPLALQVGQSAGGGKSSEHPAELQPSVGKSGPTEEKCFKQCRLHCLDSSHENALQKILIEVCDLRTRFVY